jgi:transposase
MAKPLVEDELWALIEPLLPQKQRRFRFPGRKRIEDRAVLSGIIFVLKTGIPWEALPREMGCGSGMTCWRRLRQWHHEGVWQKLHEVLLAKLHGADRIDWSRAIIDSSFVRATHRGGKTGPSPVDRSKYGSRHQVVTDATGIVLNAAVTKANDNDTAMLKPMIESLPLVHGKPGRPRQRPERLQADRGYDAEELRQWLIQQGIEPLLARRNTEHGSGLGVYRWVVERTIAWLHQSFRRLRVRDDILPDVHQALLTLGAVLVNFNFL